MFKFYVLMELRVLISGVIFLKHTRILDYLYDPSLYNKTDIFIFFILFFYLPCSFKLFIKQRLWEMTGAVLPLVIMIGGTVTGTIFSHFSYLQWHRFSANEFKRKMWIKCVERGRANFCPGNETTVCSNHFIDGKPTTRNPFPTLYKTLADMRKANSRDQPAFVKGKRPRERCAVTDTDKQSVVKSNVAEDDNDASIPTLHVSMNFEFLTREADVRFYTGFHSCETFKLIFDNVPPKAHVMLYWEGPENSNIDTPTTGYKHRIDTVLLGSNLPKINPPIKRKGPSRKLSLEQEFLMTMVRL